MDATISPTAAPSEAGPRNALLQSFGTDLTAVVIGASGGIGGALVSLLAAAPGVSHVFALSRSMDEGRSGKVERLRIDLAETATIASAAEHLSRSAAGPHLVIVASGVLHDGDRLQPEKSWRDLDADALERAFRVNCIGPAMVVRHFLPLLGRRGRGAFAALSARVGSIGDNELGGWYAYRASKAALNMIVRTAAIELRRRNPQALCVALHPGTVDTGLSQPFSRAGLEVQPPQRSAARLLRVLDELGVDDSGGFFDQHARRIAW